MSTLSKPSLRGRPARLWWRHCARCDALFAAYPEQRVCRWCEPAGSGRCAVAHPEDRSPCEGRGDAVRVVDRVGTQVYGCVAHAAVVVASVADIRAYPGSVPGAAIEAYQRAQLRAPFQFDPGLPDDRGGVPPAAGPHVSVEG